jgi:DNA-binding NtrC family response regulator
MNIAKHIMIIDDEVDLCLLMKNYLIQRKFTVHFALTLKDGMEMMKTLKPDVLFLDNNLPDGTGWTRASDILNNYPGIRLFLMSGYQPSMPNDLPAESYTLIQKPISFIDLDYLNLNGKNAAQ